MYGTLCYLIANNFQIVVRNRMRARRNFGIDSFGNGAPYDKILFHVFQLFLYAGAILFHCFTNYALYFVAFRPKLLSASNLTT